MKRAGFNSIIAIVLGMIQITGSAADVLSDEALLKFRQRMEAAPKFYSFEDRLKLRDELVRRNLGPKSLYEKNQDAYYAIQGMQQSIRQSATKKKVAGMFKTTIRTGMFAASAAATVGSLGSAAPAVSVVNGGLGLVIDPIFKAIEEDIEKGHKEAMRIHLGNMPRGALKSREEAIVSLKNMYGSDILLSDLPKTVQDEMLKNPGVFATYQKERNARIDAFLSKQGSEILELQGQSFAQGYDIEVLKKQTIATSIYLTQFAAQTRSRLENLEFSQQAMAQAMGNFESLLGKHSVTLEQNTKDIDAMKNWIAGKMTNAELVDAARTGLISINEKQLKKIELISKVESFQQNATQALNVASDMLAVADKFGMNPKLVSKISKTIAYAQAGINIASSIATGNYLGALKVVTSFFSGPDIGQQRHEQIMSALGEIQKIQIQILKNQAVLSKQIEEVQETLISSRQAILDRLDVGFNRMDVNMASISTLLTEVATAAKLDSCTDASLHFGAQAVTDPRLAQSEMGLVKFFETESHFHESKNCRDSLFKIFFEEEFLGDLRPAKSPNQLLVHGVTIDSRRNPEVDRKWNSDQDFYALLEILENFNELEPSSQPSVDQIYWGLQAETPNVNSVLLRAQLGTEFKDGNDSTKLFSSRMQPEVVANVASQLRKLFPLFNRVSMHKFLTLNELDSNNAEYRLTQNLNLMLARVVLQVTKAAEAQERLTSGSFVLPQLVSFIRQSKSYFAKSIHTRKDEVVLQTARSLAKVAQHNPYLMQNAALLMMTQVMDIRMSYDRLNAINAGELQAPKFNANYSARYKDAFNHGDLATLRTLVPRDWKVLCAEDLNKERAHRWETTFDPRQTCKPDHLGKFSYSVRMQGFDDLLESGKKADSEMDIVFSLPQPEALEGELLCKSAALIRLEEESSQIELLILKNQTMNNYSDATLRSFNQLIFGTEGQ